MPGTYNIFNIKAYGGWSGQIKTFNVWEMENGQKVWKDQSFRVYGSYDEALRDRVEFLREHSRYAKDGSQAGGEQRLYQNNNETMKTPKIHPAFSLFFLLPLCSSPTFGLDNKNLIQQTPLENSVQAIGVDPTDASNQSKADPIGLRQAYIKCLDVTGGLSPKSKECMNIEYDYQDKRLNNAHMALMKVLNKSEQDKVRSNERIWISYRDSHCEPDPDSGEAQRISAF